MSGLGHSRRSRHPGVSGSRPKADTSGCVRFVPLRGICGAAQQFAFSTIQIQNFIVVPANHVLSVVPTKNPFGWSALMPYLFFHQR
jgi:hypothetical protein